MTPASVAIEGERKTVTALFADLKGSTELMAALDPEEAREIVDPALRIMVEAVRRYEGYVVQSTGDGIFALFGAPAAYEDHPQRALYAALQMQHVLRDYGQRLRNQEKPMLEARIGINTGEVVVRTVETGGKVEYTPIGHTANLASRLQAVAPASSIAVTDQTRRLVEGYFELRPLGPVPVKGISEHVNVFEVTGLGPLRTHFELAAWRGLTRFIGRERELQQINDALKLAISGHGQLVAVVAEAGTGKSRLFHEFKAALPAECKLLEAYSVSHGKASAWLPVLELLRKYFNLEDADNAAVRREKVGAALATLDPALTDTMPYFFGLVGIQESPDPLAQMDPQIRRHRMLEAIKRIILRECLKQPTVIIFEDLHWIDSETQALLDVLADSIAGARLLLLINYRPEYRHEWSRRSHYLQLRLDPLGAENSWMMLSALLGEERELEALRQLIAERTGGNPFFIEEMVKALLEQGILARNGLVKIVRPLAEAHLPVTVQGVLAARIDALPPHDKELLQTLAVIGNDFPLALARRVTQWPEEDLQRGMASLGLGEFVYEQPLPDDVQYSFKHALTHEVAYNSLLIERRKIIHERTGQALESMFAANLDDHLAELARHYSHSDNIVKAIEYLRRAGQQAIHRSAYGDAINSLQAGIELVRKLPDSCRAQQELSLQQALGTTLIALRGYAAPEVEHAYTRARDICEQLGEPVQLFFALNGLRSVYMLRAEQGRAYELGEQMLRMAQSGNDPALLVVAHGGLGLTSVEMGRFSAAREHLETALSLYERERPRSAGAPTWAQAGASGLDDAVIFHLSYLAISLWVLGYPDQALKEAMRRSHQQKPYHILILWLPHNFSPRGSTSIGGRPTSLNRWRNVWPHFPKSTASTSGSARRRSFVVGRSPSKDATGKASPRCRKGWPRSRHEDHVCRIFPF
jgi:class 3 adenylate cyclase